MGIKVVGKSPPLGMEKLSQVVEQTFEDQGEEKLSELKDELINYARSLDNYNDALERMMAYSFSIRRWKRPCD